MPLPHSATAPRLPDRTPARVPGWRRARPLVGAAVGAALSVLAAGCTTGIFTTGIFATATPRPSAPPSESCVARCELQKSQCQGRQETREQGCQENYARGKADYALCLTAHTRRCLPPVTCLGTDMSICDRQYRPCITDCGGPRPPAPAENARADAPEMVADAAVAAASTGSAPPPGTVQSALPRTTNAAQAGAAAARTQTRVPQPTAPEFR